MTMERAGALALIVGTVVMLGVMALHPSGVPHSSDADRVMLLGIVVHGVAIVIAPVLTFGMYVVSRSVGWNAPLSVLAFLFYLFGAFCVVMAGTMSGLVAPRLIGALFVEGADQNLIHGLLRLEWYLNQSFATLHVVLFSISIILYAFAWPGRGVLAALIQILGFVIGAGVALWLGSGTLKLDVDGMGAVVLAQGVWFVLVGVGLALGSPNKV